MITPVEDLLGQKSTDSAWPLQPCCFMVYTAQFIGSSSKVSEPPFYNCSQVYAKMGLIQGCVLLHFALSVYHEQGPLPKLPDGLSL